MEPTKPPPFFFRQRAGHVNWSKLQSLNIDKIITDVDLDTLQSLLDDLTFSNIRSSEVPFTTFVSNSYNGGGESESLAVKGMQFQQLIVEYLLNVQESLNATSEHILGELRAAALHVKELDRKLADMILTGLQV